MENMPRLDWTFDWKLIIAVIALSQPWFISIYKRLFRKARVEVFEAGSIEIGFSSLGPTIGLNGTMTVKSNDTFVSAIKVKVVREKDGSTHDFEWALFRSNRVKYSQPSELEVELASGFMLMQKQAHRYNILFAEQVFIQEMNNALTPMVTAWNTQAPRPQDLQQATAGTTIEQLRESTYKEFLKNPVSLLAYNAVDRMRYWDAGVYRLTLSVETVHPDMTFETAWKFELSATDAERLSYNSPNIVDRACGIGDDIWLFAFCGYQDVD